MGARELLHELTGAGFTIEADADKLVIRPASKLTDELRAELRAYKPQLMALLTAPSTTQNCMTCRHRSSLGTCREPVAAGLAERFTIVWPEPGHGVTCPAWRRDPHEAQTLVLIEAARRLWTAAERDAWMANADADPGAVLAALRGMT